MTLASWRALVQERNSFMHVVFADDDDDDGFDRLEPLRRYRSEPAIMPGERFVYARSKMRIMVDQFAPAANHGMCAKVWGSTLSDTTWKGTREMEEAKTGEAGNATSSKRRKTRPCKGQRIRRKRFEEKMMRMVDEFPETFDFDSIDLPPSLKNDEKRQGALANRLEAHKQWVTTSATPRAMHIQ